MDYRLDGWTVPFSLGSWYLCFGHTPDVPIPPSIRFPSVRSSVHLSDFYWRIIVLLDPDTYQRDGIAEVKRGPNRLRVEKVEDRRRGRHPARDETAQISYENWLKITTWMSNITSKDHHVQKISWRIAGDAAILLETKQGSNSRKWLRSRKQLKFYDVWAMIRKRQADIYE
jgi:hypothetical protein